MNDIESDFSKKYGKIISAELEISPFICNDYTYKDECVKSCPDK